jgi:phosphatidate cytidylyltransferase
MNMPNLFGDPLLMRSVQIVAALFAFGLVVVLFFARQNLKAGLTGELGQRLIGWLLIAALFLLAVFGGGIIGGAVLLLFACRLSSEYIRVVGVERTYAIYLYALIPMTLLTAAFVPSFYFALPAGAILLLTLIPILTDRVQNLYQQLSVAGRGYLYLVWTTGHLILLQHLAGNGLLVLTAVSVALSDAMQFVVGKLIGRHVIAPHIHPRKAWEGLIGDLIGASVGVALFSFALPAQFTLIEKIILALLIGLGAAWGDLISSLVKRAAGSKDWGQLIPGHGGLLDRANSMVVVMPVVYYFAYLVMEVRK